MKMQRRHAIVLAALAASSTPLLAQQTGLTGRITDASGAVVSGASVIVQAVGAATFHTKSNNDGTWQLPSLTAGDYVVTVTAPGFATSKTKVSILIGQTADVPCTLTAGNETTVTVTADNAVVDTTSSTVSGNITPEDVKDMPINGRNYMELATLVPGVRVNAITNDTPLGSNNSGKFQINLDGLQVTQDTADPSFGQPRFSPDAITQFQIITNRFDATLGRSSGVYVNVQSKSGMDSIHGSAFGYFRSDAFNAADPIVHQVTALSDQQYGGTFGGPILKQRLWYFGSYEGERQGSNVPTTPVATNVAITAGQNLRVNEYLGRGDWQPTQKDHIFLRANGFTFKNDNVVAAGNTDPSSFYYATRMNWAILGDWDRQISAKMVNDLHIGFNHFQWQNLPEYATQAITFNGITRPDGSAGGAVTIGGPYNYPQIFYQNAQQYRDDVFYLTGKHSFKVGTEFLRTAHTGYFQQNVRGTVSNCGVVNYNLAFPNGTTSPSTWNYTEINRACANGTLTIGSGNFNVNIPRSEIAFWAQDDWKIFSRLTLNLGVRYDNDLGAFDPGLQLSNGLLTPKSNDNNNVAPRLGFVYDIAGNGKTVIRAGAGMFFADISANQTIDMQIFNGVTSLQNSVTGSTAAPLNLTNPFPTGGALPRQAVQPLGPNVATPYSLQISAGVQRELPMHAVITADFVHTRTYHDWVRLNANLLQNPANPQFNLNPSSKYTVASAGASPACPNGGVTTDGSFTASSFDVCAQAFTSINQFFTPNEAGGIYDALQLGVRQSLSHGVTSGVAYTYSRYKNSSESPFYYPNKPFVNGVHDEWANGQDDQRHTLTLNGNYAWKYGLSISGLFHYGSGNAFPTTVANAAASATAGVATAQPTGYAPSYNRTFSAGVIPTKAGTACPAANCVFVYNDPANNYLDASGYYITKRDAFYGRNIYRADSRLQERVKLSDRFSGVFAVEAFNLFNHSNYGNYNTTVNSASYGTPLQTTSAATGVPVEWRPRSLQFLARLEF